MLPDTDRSVVSVPIMGRCKVKMTKRSVMLVAALFAVVSSSALADKTAVDKTDTATSKSVVLSDAELDNITAGSAVVFTAVLNPGNANVLQINSLTNAHCVDCFPNPTGGNVRVILIQNPSHTVFKCSGGGLGLC